MPRHDQTGPMGDGALTGRGAGFCAGDSMADDRSPMQAPGLGRGFGRSRGFRGGKGRGPRAGRGGYFAQPNLPDERCLLDRQREALQSRLHVIDQRLEELSSFGIPER